MRKIRNLIFTVLSLCVVFAVTACQSGTQQSASSASPQPEETETASQTAGSTTTSTDGKTMIIYFSATNRTEGIANKIHNQLGADLFKISAQNPYSEADLNYNDNNSRANKEQNDDSARPEIAGQLPDLSSTDTIYLGMPLWWGKAPRIIQSFLEQADLSGKTVNLFCTSGSSPIEPALEQLKAAYPNVNWQKAKRFDANASDADITSWVES